jgi:hypothetical protein
MEIIFQKHNIKDAREITESLDFIKIKTDPFLNLVVHACKPSYSGGKHRRILI